MGMVVGIDCYGLRVETNMSYSFKILYGEDREGGRQAESKRRLE